MRHLMVTNLTPIGQLQHKPLGEVEKNLIKALLVARVEKQLKLWSNIKELIKIKATLATLVVRVETNKSDINIAKRRLLVSRVGTKKVSPMLQLKRSLVAKNGTKKRHWRADWSDLWWQKSELKSDTTTPSGKICTGCQNYHFLSTSCFLHISWGFGNSELFTPGNLS